VRIVPDRATVVRLTIPGSGAAGVGGLAQVLPAAAKALLAVAAVLGAVWVVVFALALSGDGAGVDTMIGIAAAALLVLVIAWEVADRDDRRRRLSAIERSRAAYRSDERS
jgi:hypothetical protein